MEQNVDAISQNKISPLHDTCYQSATCAEFFLKMVVIPLKMGEHPDTTKQLYAGQSRMCKAITYTWSRCEYHL
ncbi:hypothetical protein CDAR_215112 [Caerostris darwini]|uniref:Uncharacterized protein n=1 Tax=Caerostris darwini TaxID=1538125 RepID=A0AAV4QQY5_9ARAC|nr:hypothetical protein CDAR_215112 [Caerostris darwini]